MKLKDLFKKDRKNINKNKYNLDIGKNSILMNNFTIRGDYKDKIKIGENSMLACNIIFESNKGKVQIGNNCFINGGTNIISRENITIGNDVTIAWGCTIYDHNSHSLDWRERRKDLVQQIKDYNNNQDFIKNKNWEVVKSRPIKICDKVWIGFDCTILNGVTIGEGAIIGAKSVVRKDVEPYTIVAGNPAVKIKSLKKWGF